MFSFGGVWGGRMNEDKDSHPPSSLYLPPSLSFPGGLYGWKWGVLSATSLTQTVAPTISEDQPERGEADHHRHCGSVPLRKAAHSPGVPHGELQSALQFCLPWLWQIAEAAQRCSGAVLMSCFFFRTCCAVFPQIVAENLCSQFVVLTVVGCCVECISLL